MSKGISCPKCRSRKIVKAGFKVTTKGRKQRLQCNNCGRTFYKDK